MNTAEKVIPGPSWAAEVLELVEKGEGSFHKAAAIMQGQIDQGMTIRQVATALGKSRTWVTDILRWKKRSDTTNERSSGTGQATPFSGQGPKKRRSSESASPPERAGRRGQSMPQLERAREIVRPLMDAGKPFSCHDLEREHGISHYTFDSAICAEKARIETFTEIGAIADLSKMTAKEKLDAALRAHKKLLDREYDQRRIKEIGDHIKRIMPTLQKEKNEAFQREQTYREFLQKQKKIMTVDEFKLVLSCLHPDSRKAVTEERLKRAFQLLEPKKFALTGEKS